MTAKIRMAQAGTGVSAQHEYDYYWNAGLPRQGQESLTVRMLRVGMLKKGIPHCVRDFRSNPDRPVIRARFGILHFIAFIGAIRISLRAQPSLAQFKARIQPASKH